MTRPLRISALAWLGLSAALVLLAWTHFARIQHVTYVTALGGEADRRAATAGTLQRPSSHDLVLPEHLAGSYHWILQTRQMLARGEWRVRHVDYENAPAGRNVHSTAPYRWWLGTIAALDQVFSGRPVTQAVEWAALFADPILHGLLVLGTACFVAWRFGAVAAAVAALSLVVLFPLSTSFAGGAPDDHGLSIALHAWSVLLLLAGTSRAGVALEAQRSTRRWFMAAGVAGGLGWWVSLPAQAAVTGGVCLGAVLAGWLTCRDGSQDPILPWRTWAAGGAVTILAAYLIEYAPAHLGEWRLSAIHPLYGLAWLGCGEVLAQLTVWIQRREFRRSFVSLARLVLAALAIAAPVVALWNYQDHAFLISDPAAYRLTKLTEAVTAPALLAALLPVLLVVPAIWLLFSKKFEAHLRAGVAIATGPVVVAVGLACSQLSWWSRVDALLVGLATALIGVIGAAGTQPLFRRVLSVFGACVLLPGMFLTMPRMGTGTRDKLSRTEVIGLVERDLARWLAQHSTAGSVVVLAPPNETTALCYYGGLRGIGSLSWENRDGVGAAVRILSAPTAQEAKELIDQRGITHLVLLSWDDYFDAYARSGTGQVEGTFRDQLKFPSLPRWLRPMLYQMPEIEGFEGESVTAFEVVEEQDEPTALSRIAAHLLEAGEIDRALPIADALRRFPTNLGAWVARAEIELGRDEQTEFAKSLAMLKRRLTGRQPAPLVWDQRVRLAILLAKVKETQLARAQVAICIENVDEGKLRALPAGSLYRLLVLSHAFEISIDARLHERAMDLLPGDLRDRLK